MFRATHRITDNNLETTLQGGADFSEYEGGATDGATGAKGTAVGIGRTTGGPSLYSVHASSPSNRKLLYYRDLNVGNILGKALEETTFHPLISRRLRASCAVHGVVYI